MNTRMIIEEYADDLRLSEDTVIDILCEFIDQKDKKWNNFDQFMTEYVNKSYKDD